MSPAPATIHELITLLNRIALEHGTDIPIEFQDRDWEVTAVDIILENNVDYIDPSNTYKKLCIRMSV